MENEKIKVVLADDIDVIRRSITTILNQDKSVQVTGAAKDGKELTHLCEKEKPDVAIIDIQMPVMNGIEAAKWLRTHMPEVRLLILTTFDDNEYIQELLSIGIDGYILKACENDALINAVKSVHMGINALAPTVLNKLTRMIYANKNNSDYMQGESVKSQDNLTEIELKVASLIGKQYYNKDIASELNLTYGRVRNIVSAIYRKLGVTDRDLIKEFLSDEQVQ